MYVTLLSFFYILRFFYSICLIPKNVFQRSRDLRMEDRGKRLLLHRSVNYFLNYLKGFIFDHVFLVLDS
jgi:hypothetical protein